MNQTNVMIHADIDLDVMMMTPYSPTLPLIRRSSYPLQKAALFFPPCI